jgi:prepilin-type processing-associated H-X9-DG protein
MSSYGGNAGKRSFPPGSPPSYPGMTADGIFYIDSCVRMTDIIDGTSNTLLFGERYHRDPEYDLEQPFILTGGAPLGQTGRWAEVAGPMGAMGNVTLSAPVPFNYRVPPGGNLSTLHDRVCAFGSGPPGGANFAFADGSGRFLNDSTPLAPKQACRAMAALRFPDPVSRGRCISSEPNELPNPWFSRPFWRFPRRTRLFWG